MVAVAVSSFLELKNLNHSHQRIMNYSMFSIPSPYRALLFVFPPTHIFERLTQVSSLPSNDVEDTEKAEWPCERTNDIALILLHNPISPLPQSDAKV